MRFEWGKNGNPHGHGQNDVDGNPTFENITLDEDTNKKLIDANYRVAWKPDKVQKVIEEVAAESDIESVESRIEAETCVETTFEDVIE